MEIKNKVKVAYVVNNAAFFISHRLPIIREAKKKGYETKVFFGHPGSLTLDKKTNQIFSRYKINYKKLPFATTIGNPFIELIGLISLYYHLKKFNPDIIHMISPKGIFYGAIASLFLKTKKNILSFSGLGNIFSINISIKDNIIKKIYIFILRNIIKKNNISIIVQNKDDYKIVNQDLYVKKKDIHLIQSSGIKLNNKNQINLKDKKEIVLLPARIVIEKGIIEFCKAAEFLKKKYPKWKFYIAGTLDYSSRNKIDFLYLNNLHSKKIINLMGHVENMKTLYQKASIVCLPSYREGFPKCLIEGASEGCAILTSNVTGCRDAIKKGQTGDLFKEKDIPDLIKKIERLILNKQVREKYAKNGFLFSKQFDIQKIVNKNISLYNEVKL